MNDKSLTPAEHHPAQQITPLYLIERAINSNADLSQLEKLMDMQDRFEAAQAKKSFIRAMSEFRSKCPIINKDSQVGYDTKKGGRTAYSYSSLAASLDSIKDYLAESNLFVSWRLDDSDPKNIQVKAVVTHVDGHSESTTLSGPVDTSGNKNIIQAKGSTISYLERYTLYALLGLASKDMDDDGQGAPKAKPNQDDKSSIHDAGSTHTYTQEQSRPPARSVERIKSAKIKRIVEIIDNNDYIGFVVYLEATTLAEQREIFHALPDPTKYKAAYRRIEKAASKLPEVYADQIETCLVNGDELGAQELVDEVLSHKALGRKLLKEIKSCLSEPGLTEFNATLNENGDENE